MLANLHKKISKPRKPKRPKKTVEKLVTIWESNDGDISLYDILMKIPKRIKPQDIKIINEQKKNYHKIVKVVYKDIEENTKFYDELKEYKKKYRFFLKRKKQYENDLREFHEQQTEKSAKLKKIEDDMFDFIKSLAS